MSKKKPEPIQKTATESYVAANGLLIYVCAFEAREGTLRGRFIRYDNDHVVVNLRIGGAGETVEAEGIDISSFHIRNGDDARLNDSFELKKLRRKLKFVNVELADVIPAIRLAIKGVNPNFVLPSERKPVFVEVPA